MNTINSNQGFTAGAYALSQDLLGQSLASLSPQTQSAAPEAPDEAVAEQASDDGTDPMSQVAQQNMLSALGDSSEALAANQSAVSTIGSQGYLAVGVQGSPSADTVLGLLN